jgi:hypothetical protein
VNWVRGLHSIYLVLALGWVIYILIISPIRAHNEYVNSAYLESINCIQALPVGTPNFDSEQKRCDERLAFDLNLENTVTKIGNGYEFRLLRAFIPPLAMYLVLGPVVWFIYRAFRKSSRTGKAA